MQEPVTFWEQVWASRHVLILFTAFVGALAVSFRPGSAKRHHDAADVPFRHEDKPAASIEEARS